jgi:glycosyltransferase involved in cell wall biosynthesis
VADLKPVDWVILSRLDPSAGGRETWCYSFLPTLLAAERGIELRVYGQRLEGEPDYGETLRAAVAPEDRDRLKPLLFPTRRTRLPLFFNMARQLRAQMARNDVAPCRYVVAAGSILEHLMVLSSPKLRDSFKVVWLRTIFLDAKSDRLPGPFLSLARWVEGQALKRADLLIANGDDIAEYYRKRFGLDVAVIRNGIDTRRWKQPPPSLGTPIRIAFVGRLTVEKGVAEFLKLVRTLRGGPFEFHVVGSEGPGETDVRAAAAQGLLHYHGVVANADMPALLGRFDACVALTRVSRDKGGGGTSNALMEQMAAGRVILAWDNVIFRQVLDENTAYIVPQDDVDALAAAARRISQDSAQAQAKAAAAEAAVIEHSLDTQLRKFLGLIRERLGS